MMFFCYLIVFLCLLPCTLPAQQPYMWRLADEDGLPSMTIYDLKQDSRGYMWFGTEAGICRFDGRTFKLFSVPTAKSRSATTLTEDRFGNIWFRNFAKQIFSIQKDHVQEFSLPTGIKDALDYRFGKGDSLLLMDWNSIYITSTKQHQWRKVLALDKDGTNNFWNIHYDTEGFFWLFATNGIYKYQHGTISQIHKEDMGRHLSVKDRKVYVFNDQKSELSVWENGKRTILFGDNFKHLAKQLVHSFYIDKAHNYWFCTSAGVFGYDSAGKALWAGKVLLPDIDVSHLIQDREGSYWIATLKEGVFIMPQLDILIYNHLNSNLPAQSVNCLENIADKTLVLGFNNGNVCEFTASKGVELTYQTNRKQQVEELYYHAPYQKLYVSVGSLLAFQVRQPALVEANPSGAIKKIAFLNNQDAVIAAGAEAKIFRMHPFMGKESILDMSWLKRYPLSQVLLANTNSYTVRLLNKRTRTVWADRAKQRFWVGSVDGLFCYQKNGVREVLDELGKPIFAISLRQDATGTLWIGTIEQGLYALRDNKVVHHFTTKNGLAGNFCRGIWTENKYIWFSTGKGIQRYDTKTMTFELLNKQDGLHTYDVLDLRVWRDTLWVATPKGLLCMPKDSLKRNIVPPLIYIQSFQVAEKEQAINDTYILAYSQNNLKIEFQGLAYRSRSGFRYKYRMLGLDSAWVFTDPANGFARYPSLPTGSYEFQVKAVNEDGIESDGMAILQIVILPPWWQTWWATALWLLLLVGGLWSIFWLRLKRVQERGRIEQELRSSQLSTLKVQMNPHFIFNALNSIQEFIWLNEKRLANQYLGKFADLMRLTLDMSNEKEVSLADEVKVLRLYLELENVRFENLAYTLQVHEDMDEASIYIPSMLIQPYIENAIKHGLLHKQGSRDLRIEISKQDDFVLCVIQDNGVGRKRSQEIQQAQPKRHKSFATSATQKRLELLNYGREKRILVKMIDIEEAGKASGTRVEVQIPVSHNL